MAEKTADLASPVLAGLSGMNASPSKYFYFFALKIQIDPAHGRIKKLSVI